MKTVLVAFNARYSHSSLALRYIKANNPEKNIEIAEYTINDQIHYAYGDLLSRRGDVYCFSVYIWNLEITVKVAQMLKKANPQSIIVFGGPECSYCPKELFGKYSFIDYILRGEGEVTTGKLIECIENDEIPNTKGIATRDNMSALAENVDLDTIKFPYQSFKGLENKIVYFETSRGCPFKCSYCLSSVEEGIRYFPMEYVKKGFDKFFENNIPLVKLIDRTFNANSKRAVEIVEYIINNSKNTKVHFEIDPGILTDELVEILVNAPRDLFQLEMGIQSANEKTLQAVNRNIHLDKIAENVAKLKCAGNMHLHLDLIAGLPFENYESFKNSFNYVYSMKPDMLQLGFLKVLHGTPIQKHGDIVYCDFPPYEVLSTKWIKAEEICRLKLVDKAVDAVNNSGAFKRTLSKLVKGNAFEIFEKISVVFDTNKIPSRFDLYEKIYDIFGDDVYIELCLDFIENSPNRPMPLFASVEYPNGFKKKCINAMGDVFSMGNVRFEPIGNRVYMMDYKVGQLRDITEEYEKVLA